MRSHQEKEQTLGFQIAPMVDIVFILILFFMTTVGAIKTENELNIKLPGRITQAKPVKMFDEQIVQVQANGQVLMNDQVLGEPADRELPNLATTLKRFKGIADSSKIQALVTISTAPKAKYERVIDVLNICAAARIEGVTFAVWED